MFVDLCHYLDETQLFLNPDLKVEVLARALHTNRTTLGECVKKYANGFTVLQFLNRNLYNFLLGLFRIFANKLCSSISWKKHISNMMMIDSVLVRRTSPIL